MESANVHVEESCGPMAADAEAFVVSPIFATIALPAYNEGDSIESSYLEIAGVMDPLGHEYEFLFIDDGSTDGTWQAIKRLAERDPRVRGLRHRVNSGKARALANGFRYARGGLIVTCDADLQYDPDDIVRVIDKVVEGYDAVSANKVVRRDPLSKRIPSKVFNFFVRRITGVNLHDMNAGLKAYRYDAAQELVRFGYGELHRFYIVILALRGYSVAEVPVESRPRLTGRSKYGIERYVRGAMDFLTVIFLSGYMERPLHLFGGLGLLSGLIGGLIFAGIVVERVAFGFQGGDLLLQIAALLVVTSLQMLVVGLVAEMIHYLDHGTQTRGRVFEVVNLNRRSVRMERRLPRD